MAFDIPFTVLVLYMAIITVIFLVGLVMGLRRIVGAPFICVFSGLMMFALIVLIENIEVGYVEAINYTLSYPMNQTVQNSFLSFTSTTTVRAEKVNNIQSLLFQEPISCISMNLQRTGAPTGNVDVGIFDSTGMLVKLFGSTVANTLPTSGNFVKHCLTNHDYYLPAQFDRIGARHTTSTGTDFVSAGISTTNTFDGTNSIRSTLISGVYTDTTTDDMTMILIFDNANILGQAILHPFNQEDIFPFTIVLTVFYIFVGIIIQMQVWRKD